MDLNKEKYIILEIIPTKIKDGDIAELSALKLEGIKLIDRLNIRLDKKLINIPDIINMTNYDNDKFTYYNSSKEIKEELKKFIEDLPLLIIDNLYTENYLTDIKNKKESVFKYLNMKYSSDVFEKIIDKYKLESSNYLVDLLYEALIKEL